jgi:hypothetical protein
MTLPFVRSQSVLLPQRFVADWSTAGGVAPENEQSMVPNEFSYVTLLNTHILFATQPVASAFVAAPSKLAPSAKQQTAPKLIFFMIPLWILSVDGGTESMRDHHDEAWVNRKSQIVNSPKIAHRAAAECADASMRRSGEPRSPHVAHEGHAIDAMIPLTNLALP